MPIYEYECTRCGGIQEVFQKFSDKPWRKCPECSGKLHKLISHSAFHLKGSGWYVTDYANRSKDVQSTEPAEGASPSAPEKKLKSEKKPAKKAS